MKNPCSMFPIIFILALITQSIHAFDAGIDIGIVGGYGNQNGIDESTFALDSKTWFSAVLADKLSFYLSATLAYNYRQTEFGKRPVSFRRTLFPPPFEEVARFLFIPERSELMLDIREGFSLEAGRVHYGDYQNIVVNGLFDGLKCAFYTGFNTVSLGALYSGLQQGESAKIIMSRADADEYYNSDFYFAPQRLLLSIDYKREGFFGTDAAFRTAFLSQLDFRMDSNARFNSQYVIASIKASPYRVIGFEAGAVLEFKQAGEDAQGDGSRQDKTERSAAFIAKTALQFNMRSSAFTLEALYASGDSTSTSNGKEDSNVISAYIPVTSFSAGEIWNASIVGVCVLKAELGATDGAFKPRAAVRYFLQTDNHSIFNGTPSFIPGTVVIGGIPASGNAELGLEIFAAFEWAFFDDFKLNAGGGAFFPSQDGALAAAGVPMLWKFEVGLNVEI